MRGIQHWASRKDIRIIWTGIPQFQKPPENMRRTITDLNILAEDIFERDYIPAIPPQHIHPGAWDMTGIHYTTSTAQTILNSIIEI